MTRKPHHAISRPAPRRIGLRRQAGRLQAAAHAWRACGARSTGSTRSSSACSIAAPRSSSQIGQVKQDQGLEVWSAAREDEVIAQALAASQGPLPARDAADHLPRADERLAGRCSGTLRVAYLGPKYSYSHLAAVAKFGEAVEHVPVGSIAAVFEEVNRRHVQFGLVPLENSTDGRIADTLDMFVRLPEPEDPGRGPAAGPSLPARPLRVGPGPAGLFQVAGAVAVPQLAGQEPAAGDARSRSSRRPPPPSWPSARSSPPPSPAAPPPGLPAQRPGREHRGPAPQRHPLRRHRRTRRASAPASDKTTLMIRLPNQAGSLAKTIAPFEKFGVNMTWIESFPIPDGDRGDERTRPISSSSTSRATSTTSRSSKALEAVRKRCERLDILGSYPRSECIET